MNSTSTPFYSHLSKCTHDISAFLDVVPLFNRKIGMKQAKTALKECSVETIGDFARLPKIKVANFPWINGRSQAARMALKQHWLTCDSIPLGSMEDDYRKLFAAPMKMEQLTDEDFHEIKADRKFIEIEAKALKFVSKMVPVQDVALDQAVLLRIVQSTDPDPDNSGLIERSLLFKNESREIYQICQLLFAAQSQEYWPNETHILREMKLAAKTFSTALVECKLPAAKWETYDHAAQSPKYIALAADKIDVQCAIYRLAIVRESIISHLARKDAARLPWHHSMLWIMQAQHQIRVIHNNRVDRINQRYEEMCRMMENCSTQA